MTQPAASTVSKQTALPSTYPKTSPKPRAPAAGAVTRSEKRTTLCRRRIGLQGSPRQPYRGPKATASSQSEAITKRILTTSSAHGQLAENETRRNHLIKAKIQWRARNHTAPYVPDTLLALAWVHLHGWGKSQPQHNLRGLGLGCITTPMVPSETIGWDQGQQASQGTPNH